jgi:hypothetical protein
VLYAALPLAVALSIGLIRPAGAVSVDSVFIYVFRGHTNNTLDSPPYEVELTACGSGITGVTVTPPIGGSVPLIATTDGCWEQGEPNPSFATAPTGGYEFTFNGSPGDTATVPFAVAEPSGFANVTFPIPNSIVGLEPNFQWDDVSGFATDGIEVYVDGPDRDEEPSADLPITATNWDPWPFPQNPLAPASDYTVNVDIFNLVESSDMTTDGGDPFFYERGFISSNEVAFQTPEPSTSLLIGLGLAALAATRRLQH